MPLLVARVLLVTLAGLQNFWFKPLQTFAVVLLVFMVLMLLLLLVGFGAGVREGGVNEKTLSPPPRALRGPTWGPVEPSVDGGVSSLRHGGKGRRDSNPWAGRSFEMGQSSGAGSGKEKAGTLGTSPSSLSQGKAEDGGRW